MLPSILSTLAGVCGGYLGYTLASFLTYPLLHPLTVLAIVGATYATQSAWTWGVHTVSPRPRRALRARRLSFMSELISDNPFPDAAETRDCPIHAALFMDSLPSVDEIVALTSDVLLAHDRFACPVLPVPPTLLEHGFRAWGPRPSTPDWAYHVQDHPVDSEHAALSACQDLVGDVLDPEKPLWQVRLLRTPGNGGVFLLRISHVVGDGVSLVHTLISLLTRDDGEPYQMPAFARRNGRRERSLGERLAGGAAFVVGSIKAGIKVLTLPSGPRDTPNAVKRSLVGWRQPDNYVLARTRPVSLDRIKAIKTALGATINDVIATALALAVRSYLVSIGDTAALQANSNNPLLRVFLPYAFAQREKPLTNKWCFLSLTLPMAEADPSTTLAGIKAEIDALKSTPEAYFQLYLQQLAAAVLPTQARKQTALDIMLSHSLVFTNVPGPPSQVFLAGKPVRDIMVWIGNLISQVSALSYNGSITTTFVLDATTVPDPSLLVDHFEAAFDTLERAASASST